MTRTLVARSMSTFDLRGSPLTSFCLIMEVYYRPLEEILGDGVELERWRKAQKPVCVRDCLSSWPAVKKWKEKDYLRTCAGDAPIEVPL